MSTSEVILWAVLMLVGIGGSAFCSGLEVGLYSVNRVRVQVEGAQRSGARARRLRTPTRCRASSARRWSRRTPRNSCATPAQFLRNSLTPACASQVQGPLPRRRAARGAAPPGGRHQRAGEEPAPVEGARAAGAAHAAARAQDVHARPHALLRRLPLPRAAEGLLRERPHAGAPRAPRSAPPDWRPPAALARVSAWRAERRSERSERVRET